MKNIITCIMALILLTFISTAEVHAAKNIAGHSATLITGSVKTEDSRVIKLRAYLEERNSPLAPYAEVFVSEADKYNLDWKFIVSISGVESGYGKRIPVNSHNGWGWGIYGGKVTRFASWEEGIQTISRDIRVKYMDARGARDIYDIGRTYAANPHWADRVTYFMNRLDSYEQKSETLPISI